MSSMRTLSSNEFKNKDIVCVGTIDERKNQISLIKALMNIVDCFQIMKVIIHHRYVKRRL